MYFGWVYINITFDPLYQRTKRYSPEELEIAIGNNDNITIVWKSEILKA